MSRPLDETALATLSDSDRAEAHRRWLLLRAYLDDGVPLTHVAAQSGIPHRTLQRWLARYRAGGLAGLARAARADRGRSRFPEPLRLLVEGLALRTPVPSTAHVHRQVAAVAEREGWAAPSYSTVYAIIRGIDPALRTLAVEGAKRYAEVFELVYRRQASRPNENWQADHTQLDLWVVTPAGKPARPWLTVIEDDHSRAIAGYAVNLGAPSALQTALVLRQAIWRKAEPGWHVCGIPSVFYTDHGSDFISQHMEQVAADLRMRLVFSLPGRPRGRGKVERYMDTINQMCLPGLPGYAPPRHQGPRRPGSAEPGRTRRGDRGVHRQGLQPPRPQRDRPATAGPLGGRRLPAAPARVPGTTRPATARRRQTPQDPPGRHPVPRTALR